MATPATFELSVEGMTCASCAGRVERALSKVQGVEQARVNLASERAQVQARAGLSAAQLIEAVEKAGYQARLTGDPLAQSRAERRARLREQAWLVLAFTFAVPLVLPMLLSPFGVQWALPAWAQLALATPVQCLAGARFYVAAWKALRARAANMDLLVALGTSAAFGLSLFLWLRAAPGHPPHLYFETSAVVIALVLLGKAMEGRAKRRAAGAIRALEALRPLTAQRLEDGIAHEVPVACLRIGDLLRVRPGERVAADGRIKEGESHLHESLLTGEALPVAKGPGDKVNGGTLNGEGALVVEITATGTQTLLEGIIRLVETAQAAKAPVQHTVDRISEVFVPFILLLAMATGLGWYWLQGSLEQALVTAVSVLVIACPCALGLATPAAILAGTGVAARHGVLIKDIGVIEFAHRIGHVVFDKTGTLTQGTPELVEIFPLAGERTSVLAEAAALGAGSQHPLAQAVARACAKEGMALTAAMALSVLPGRGIAGEVEGRRMLLGSSRLLHEHGLETQQLDTIAQAWEDQGRTFSWLIQLTPTPAVLGAMAFADQLRPWAAAAVQALQQKGITCHLLTGDNAGSAAQVASALGISEVQAQLLPADKAQRVVELSSHAPVAMVGDGINDAPALAAASIGIAMGGASDVAAQAGAVVLARADLRLVPASLALANRIRRKIHQNLFWAFAYNLVGLPLAVSGMLSPMFAGAAMALSSVCVVTNALLLARWSPDFDPLK